MGQEPLEGDLEHAISPRARFMLVEHRVGGGVVHLVDDPAVGQEHDAVGVGGGDRVVGDHHDGLAEVVDGRAHEARGSRRWRGSRGCRWARRRR